MTSCVKVLGLKTHWCLFRWFNYLFGALRNDWQPRLARACVRWVYGQEPDPAHSLPSCSQYVWHSWLHFLTVSGRGYVSSVLIYLDGGICYRSRKTDALVRWPAWLANCLTRCTTQSLNMLIMLHLKKKLNFQTQDAALFLWKSLIGKFKASSKHITLV